MCAFYILLYSRRLYLALLLLCTTIFEQIFCDIDIDTSILIFFFNFSSAQLAVALDRAIK